MADKYSVLEHGTIDPSAIVIDAIANAAVSMWAPVKLVADASITNGLPRVTETTTANDPLANGVACGGVTQGGTGGSAADAAGKTVRVCIYGRTKIKVDGSGTAIALNDPLQTHTTTGVAVKAANLPSSYDSTARRNIIAYALQTSSASGDYIACLVTRNG